MRMWGLFKRIELDIKRLWKLEVQTADCCKDTIPSFKQFSMIVALIHQYDSHGLLLQLFPICNDVRHAVLSYGNLTAIYPLTKDIRGSFVWAGLLAYGIELLLEVLDLLTVLFDIAFILIVDSLHDLLHLKLVAHHRLCPPPLAARLEDVNTSALGCYLYEQDS